MRRISQSVVAAALSAGVVCAAATGAAAGGPPAQHPVPEHRGIPCVALSPSVTETEGAAGSTYWTITYRNVGSRTCFVSGYPGVAFVDGHGHQLGATAARTGGPPKLVTLRPGGKATITLREVHAGLQVGCETAKTYRPAAGLRITAPRGGFPRYLSAKGTNACLNRSVQQLTVGPIMG
ncbi:DUF4232 domain-containing protein [Pseudofrankia inefficax]|uniref:DUF4232 domain-containing protein n=1 Tax=Pseudofrankia inefficax (strain DSM 45817 / CECT 9037 / DDB 130130 / EuI1c) TaxID=298654 RepID=E3J5S5_PSEI1|nr:DUF4232 domain-containing protein [Pseudofrankia inefficax]ADP83162.1 hypothetical protein FraEuI1c_5173 [Pseudofrankia inefficax]